MRRRVRQISLQECYSILKLDKDADLAALKRAYRRRAFELHPDLHPDNPEAGHDFQRLNEAYVALSAMLEQEERIRAATEAKRAARQAKTAAAQEKASGGQGEKKAAAAGPKDGEDGKAEQDAQAKADATHRTRQNAYTEHDVLRDLLNDPFARRVFEDIYSELNRQQKEAPKTSGEEPQPEPRAAAPDPPPHAAQTRAKPASEQQNVTLHKENLAWGTPKWTKDMSKGVGGVVKGWLRRQIDEEQHLSLPSAALLPGRRIRLQIRQAFSGELKTIEITLPRDFTPGKPIRLRGLGKRVGPWQGDLYLTISNE